MPVLGKMKRRPDVVCDVFIPASRFARFWDWYREVFDFWPLWVVPYRPAEVYPWIGAEVRERLDSELFIDLAVYGASNSARDRDLSVLLEEAVWDLGGIKTLIGATTTNASDSGGCMTVRPTSPPRSSSIPTGLPRPLRQARPRRLNFGRDVEANRRPPLARTPSTPAQSGRSSPARRRV
ncbi:MAG TPA: hypothetical protein VJM33_20230 [Microthrixaceae bacterium]|nr:hypothetical protein [Microthrixaceae bacterium]